MNKTESPAFRTTVRAAFLELLGLYKNLVSTQYPSFASSMNITLRVMTRASRAMKWLSVDDLHLFEYEPCGERKRWLDSAWTREKIVVARVKKAWEVQGKIGVRKEQAIRKGLSESMEWGILRSRKMAVSEADEKFQGNPEAMETSMSKKGSLSENKKL